MENNLGILTAGLLFRITSKYSVPDPTIFAIKNINKNEVIISWQDIHGRGERTATYILNDVKNKFKFKDWEAVNPIEIIAELQGLKQDAAKMFLEMKNENFKLEKQRDHYKALAEAAHKIIEISGVVDCDGFSEYQALKQTR